MGNDLKSPLRYARMQTAGSGGGSGGGQPPSSAVSKTSQRAARLIEAAMLTCTETDLRALDCLLEARRALSPIVDARKDAK